MYNPVSTYRIQFNKDFTFSHFDSLITYFQQLGVTTIYASPIFAAVPESLHGYDGVDDNRINPELGTDEQFRAISQRLKQAGMGWIQDIVPNHMAYHVNNDWLMDLLEKGSLSRYTAFFDTSFASSFFHGRVMAPFLSESINETLAKGELTVTVDQERFMVKIGGEMLPLNPGSYAAILQANPDDSNDAVRQLLDELDQIRHIDEPEAYAIAWAEFRQQLTALQQTTPTEEYIRECLEKVNADPVKLRQLIDNQNYRLCSEPDTRLEINYRRFFISNGLICLNMSDKTVFQQVHRLIKTMADEGIFQGFRVDHVDGLLNPVQYLDRLRRLVGDDSYIVVEKVLQNNERLPESWPVEGTSGYDFLAMVNNLLTDSRNEQAFRDFYNALIGSDMALPDRIRDRKAYFLAQYMGGELDNLYHYFLALNLADEAVLADLTVGELTLTIGELLVNCPVYRYYGSQFPMPDDEAVAIRKLLKTIRLNNPNLATSVAILESALLTKPPVADADFNHRAALFYQRLMQLSGPLMAKGVEDTLLYTYTCFVGHNEVGDSPERFGLSTDDFHKAMQDRQRHWPLTQNTTATHDTKRSEDARARLNSLTDLADEWLMEVQEWQRLNAEFKRNDSPDSNDEYFIYQNLLGHYPMPGQDEDNFPERFKNYIKKSLQEAKRHTTDWEIGSDYYAGIQSFIDRLLDKKGSFWMRFRAFHWEIADFGVVNSLAQVVLKFMCPGVPDIYQGGEVWDFNMVDPDNRRPVDFAKCQQWLTDLTARRPLNESTPNGWADLWKHRFDGRIKFWLTHLLLQERQKNAVLFAEGQYVPLLVEGTCRAYVLAFARQYLTTWYVVIVPLHSAQFCWQQRVDVLSLDWQDTQILLPAHSPTSWANCLTGTTGDESNSILVQSVFSELPVALLRLE